MASKTPKTIEAQPDKNKNEPSPVDRMDGVRYDGEPSPGNVAASPVRNINASNVAVTPDSSSKTKKFPTSPSAPTPKSKFRSMLRF